MKIGIRIGIKNNCHAEQLVVYSESMEQLVSELETCIQSGRSFTVKTAAGLSIITHESIKDKIIQLINLSES